MESRIVFRVVLGPCMFVMSLAFYLIFAPSAWGFAEGYRNGRPGYAIAFGGDVAGETSGVPGAAGPHDFVAIVEAKFFTMCMDGNGDIVSWGTEGAENFTGTDYIKIAGAMSTGMGLHPNGTVSVWGETGEGQGAIPPEAQHGDVISIAVGSGQMMALRSNGQLIVWASDTGGDGPWGGVKTGQPGKPGGVCPNDSFIAINSGNKHCIALRDIDGDGLGEAVVWGGNGQNQCVVPEAAKSGVIDVSAGRYHLMALKEDGTIIVWGDDLWTPPYHDFIDISDGGQSRTALRANGSAVVWGVERVIDTPSELSALVRYPELFQRVAGTTNAVETKPGISVASTASGWHYAGAIIADQPEQRKIAYAYYTDNPVVNETGGTTSRGITIYRTGSTASAMTVNYEISGSATRGVDYTLSPSGDSVTIPVGADSAVVTVTALDDTAIERTEDVKLTITSGGFDMIGVLDHARIFIADNEWAPPAVSIAAVTDADERAGSGNLEGDIDNDGDVDWGDLGVFAGYWLQSGCGTCGGADMTGNGKVDISDFARLANKWLQDSLSGKGIFRITRTGGSQGPLGLAPVRVWYSFTGTEYYLEPGHARSGGDFVPLGSDVTRPSIGSIIIPQGQSSVDLIVVPKDDGCYEGYNNETVGVTLQPYEDHKSYDEDYTLGTAAASIGIVDNESPVSFVSIGSAKPAVSENGSSVNFVMTRSDHAGNASPLTVAYTVAGSAIGGSDYTALSGSVTIPAGSYTANIPVVPTNDTKLEGMENVIVTIKDIGCTNYMIGTPFSCEMIVTDDDWAVEAGWDGLAYDDFEDGWGHFVPGGTGLHSTISCGGAVPEGNCSAIIDSGERDSSAIFYNYPIDVAAPGYTKFKILFDFKTENLAGEEFSFIYYNGLQSGESYLPEGYWYGQTYKVGDDFSNGTVYHDKEVVITVDNNYSTDRYKFPDYIKLGFWLDATAATDKLYVDRVRLLAYPAVPLPDTSPPSPAPSLVTPLAVEGTSITVTCTASADATGPVEYYFESTNNPSVINSGWQTGASWTAAGLAENTQYTFRVKARDKVTPTPNETGWSTTASATTGNPVTPPTITISATDASASESGDAGQFTVTRNTSGITDKIVYYTVSGTATAASDYQSLSGSVTIAAGATTATVTVTPINDMLIESSETVILTISANAGYVVGSPSSATVTIADDDTPNCQDPGWTALTCDSFENGWGSYTSGGANANVNCTSGHATDGTCVANIELGQSDGSSTLGSFTHTSGLYLTSYKQLKVKFDFYASTNVGTGEGFRVEYYDGSAWRILKDYIKDTNYTVGTQYTGVELYVFKGQYAFPVNAKIRFQNHGNSNTDDIYIDNVKVMANVNASASEVELFLDDFDRGGNITDTGEWTIMDTNTKLEGAAKHGSAGSGISIKYNSWAQSIQPSSGFQNIHLKYWRKTFSFEPADNDKYYTEWSVDGTVWNTLETVTSTLDWAYVDNTCASGANNNANYRVRLRMAGSATNDYIYIDDVKITGYQLP